MTTERPRLDVYLPVIGFSEGQIGDLVISAPVQTFVKGIYIDPYTLMSIDLRRMQKSLRLSQRPAAHTLEILIGFNAPFTNFELIAAREVLKEMVHILHPDAILLMVSHQPVEWVREMATMLADTPSERPVELYMRQRKTGGFFAVNPDVPHHISFDVVDDRLDVPPMPLKDGRRSLILSSGLIHARNQHEHARILHARVNELA